MSSTPSDLYDVFLFVLGAIGGRGLLPRTELVLAIVNERDGPIAKGYVSMALKTGVGRVGTMSSEAGRIVKESDEGK